MYESGGIVESADNTCRMYRQNEKESDATESTEKDPRNPRSVKTSEDSRLEECVARVDTRALPSPLSASTRRHRLQRQKEVSEPSDSSAVNPPGFMRKLPSEAHEKGSLTSGMRKKYLKELLLNKSGLSSIFLSTNSCTTFSKERYNDGSQYSAEESTNNRTFWALDPTEHAWMLSVVDGNFDTIVDYLREDFSLLTKKDFVTGFTVLHWLAKYGKDETLIKLLKHAEKEGFPVNVNLKASGGFTPLHVAAMHGQYMVIKILVGAFSANINAMDYSGRRPWQYLHGNGSEEMKELLGALDDEPERDIGYQNANNNSASAAQRLTDDRRNQVKHILDPSFKTNERWRTGTIRKFLFSLWNIGNGDRR